VAIEQAAGGDETQRGRIDLGSARGEFHSGLIHGVILTRAECQTRGHVNEWPMKPAARATHPLFSNRRYDLAGHLRRYSMHTRNIALLAALALTAGTLTAFAPAASAQVSIGISVGTPPPPLRYEVVPPPRVGYVWAPGYWDWGGASYVWVTGAWHRDRPGYVYYQPRWVNERGRWVQRRAYWGHDNGRHNGWYKDHGNHGDRGRWDDDQGNQGNHGHRGNGRGHGHGHD
jgi:hypothetical protein